MTKRIKVTMPRGPAVRSTSHVARELDPKTVANALGANQTGVKLDLGGSPASLFALRGALSAALGSSGGRPGLKGAGRRQKIPMMDADWSELENLAASLHASGLKATAGQIAGQLLHDAIVRLKASPVGYPAVPPATTLRVSEPRHGASERTAPADARHGIRSISDHETHGAALLRIAALWNVRAGSPEEKELEALATLVDAYERRAFAIRPPTPGPESVAARNPQASPAAKTKHRSPTSRRTKRGL
jgi:hypothetical protein